MTTEQRLFLFVIIELSEIKFYFYFFALDKIKFSLCFKWRGEGKNVRWAEQRYREDKINWKENYCKKKLKMV